MLYTHTHTIYVCFDKLSEYSDRRSLILPAATTDTKNISV